ncbi:MAG: lipid-binding SYLF domain-containing protein [Proteobacteria bacterium]|nr:lipid-binding SYLF domain-containing protein [Pseudomonadota bacterium]
MSRLFARLVLLLALFATLPAWAANDPTDAERTQMALKVLRDIQSMPEQAIPDRLFDEAQGILVVPDTLKIGFIFGGRRGHGLLSIRNPDGTWSNPVYVRLTGGSVGFQIGVSKSDVVMVFRTRQGLNDITAGKLTLGAGASVATGPVGRDASANTDQQFKADIWSWSRARGLYAGVAFDGAVIAIDDEANQRMYGTGSTPRMIFEHRTPIRPPNVIVDFRDALEEAGATAHNRRMVQREKGADIDRAVEAAERGAAAASTPAPSTSPDASGTAPSPPEQSNSQPEQDAGVTTEALPAPTAPAKKKSGKP